MYAPLKKFPWALFVSFLCSRCCYLSSVNKTGVSFFFPLETKGLRLSKALGWIRCQVMRGKTGVVMRHNSLKGRAFGSITFKVKVGIKGRCWDRKGKVSDQRPATPGKSKATATKVAMERLALGQGGKAVETKCSQKAPPF